MYDALNVLMAMNIISKEKKEIRWLGLPTNSVQEAYRSIYDDDDDIDNINDSNKVNYISVKLFPHLIA